MLQGTCYPCPVQALEAREPSYMMRPNHLQAVEGPGLITEPTPKEE